MFGFEADGDVIVQQQRVLEAALSTNPKTQKALQKLINKVLKDARLDVTMNTSDDKFTAGERNGVEMVKYQIDGHSLYITFKQVVDELGSFAKFKLLYYKGDKIVGTEDGYFNISAENLNGNGSTDVAELWILEGEFDKVEYVFEP